MASMIESLNQTIDALQQLNPALYARFMNVRKICDDTFLQAYDDLTTNPSEFQKHRWTTANSGSIVRLLRLALFTAHRLSDARLTEIAKEAEPNKTLIDCAAQGIPSNLVSTVCPAERFVYLDSMRKLARQLEAAIDTGVSYACVQADGLLQKEPAKRENIIFELHAFRRYMASRCGRPGCGVVRDAEKKDEKMFQRCAKCTTVYYCSRTCQVEHWKSGHAKGCHKATPNDLTRAFDLLGDLCPVHSFRYGEQARIELSISSENRLRRLNHGATRLIDKLERRHRQ